MNVSVRWVTDSMMDLAWSRPSMPNGKLEGYRIFYMQKNFTDVVTVKPPPPNMTFALTNLGEFLVVLINFRVIPTIGRVYVSVVALWVVNLITPYSSHPEPFTEYKLWVKAFTWKNEGESSDTLVIKTDVGGPSPPRIVNVSCQAEDALFIQWQRPTRHQSSIDFYYVDYRRDDWAEFEEITVTAHPDQNEQTVWIILS